MSDVTNSRRAQEFLDASDQTPSDPRLLMKAAIHATLASARALRELDGTTHRSVRLIGDSVDELRDDLVPALRVKLLVLDEGIINVTQITAMVDVSDEDDDDDATQTEIWLADRNVIYSRSSLERIVGLMAGAI